jgi:hypothetical protein
MLPLSPLHRRALRHRAAADYPKALMIPYFKGQR